MNAINDTSFPMCKLISLKQVSLYTGLSRTTIYELLNPKSKYFDATFPKQVNLTLNRVGWVAQEVNDWILLKVSQR